jgi:hypothetical protein
MSRWKAFSIHLIASVAVLAALGAVMLETWYDKGLLQFARADRLFLIIASVDIILGPLLTLLVFRTGKPKLKLDLSLIVLVQVAFLAFGLKTVWDSRPVYLVALPEQFVLIFANDIPAVPADHPDSEHYEALPWFGPELVGVAMPTDAVRATNVIMQAAEGRDLTSFPEYYIEFEQMSASLLANASDMDRLFETVDSAQHYELSDLISNLEVSDPMWVPVLSARGDATMLIDPRDARPLRALSIPPSGPNDEPPNGGVIK